MEHDNNVTILDENGNPPKIPEFKTWIGSGSPAGAYLHADFQNANPSYCPPQDEYDDLRYTAITADPGYEIPLKLLLCRYFDSEEILSEKVGYTGKTMCWLWTTESDRELLYRIFDENRMAVEVEFGTVEEMLSDEE